MDRFKERKNDVDGKEQYRVEISNRFAAFENFNSEVDAKRAKLQWLQDASEINRYNLKNIKRASRRHVGNKRGNI
jgi:hypothetical protein